MLAELYIENFVIIEKVSIEFKNGFNVITGETGAGKTILVNALKLLLGDRFQKSYLGKYGNRSIVEGKFIINSKEKLKRFEDGGYELEDGVLIVTREATESSSINRINGRNVTLGFLKEIMEDLIDIHSQNENQALLKKANYLNILDAFSPGGNRELLKELNNHLKELKKLQEEKSSLDLSSEEIDRQKDILSFQIEELSSLELENLDENQLENELKLLSNMDNIKTTLGEINSSMRNEDYGQFDILDSLNDILKELSDLKEIDLELSPIFDRIESCYYELEDVYMEMKHYQDSLFYDDERLNSLNETLSTITNLKRKYGPTIDDLIDFRQQAISRLETLEKVEENIQIINRKIKKVQSKCEVLAEELSNIRKKQAKKLEKDILNNIRNLNMPNAKFSIDFETSNEIGSKGKDVVEFNIATNVGQDLNPISKVASGGELSRIMLALKTSLASIDNVDTLIFDEVDTGISGRTAILVGEKLQKISKVRQIITISHLAQIASLASFHILIEKNEDEQGTISNIRPIYGEERVMEMSRLIGGIDITENTINQARDMIKQGELLFNREVNTSE